MGMTKKLLIVFASGLMLSLILLSAAWVVGGDELRKRIGDGKGVNVTIDGHHGGPETTRELTFDPAVPLTISTPVKLRFVRGDAVAMSISGPANAIDALRWEDGKLSGARGIHIGGGEVKVTITAPRLSALLLESAAEAQLIDLNQPSLKIETRGAAEVEASGKVGSLEATTAGASELDFADLAVGDAKVETRGAGDVALAASGKVDIVINGVGSVSLKRKPAELTSRIHGIGTVDHDY